MKRHPLALLGLVGLVGLVAALASTTAWAQFVKGNEAVTVLPDGKKKVVTPPLPSATLAAPCPAEKVVCAVSGWRMIETAEGLRECTEPFARPGTCRPSTYGTQKASRIWIVKKGALLSSEWVPYRL